MNNMEKIKESLQKDIDVLLSEKDTIEFSKKGMDSRIESIQIEIDEKQEMVDGLNQ